MKVHLQLWDRPSDYFGYNPTGHIMVYAIHREASILEQSNYYTIARELLAAVGDVIGVLPDKSDPMYDNPIVYEWQASHWAVGWIRYLMIAPQRGAKPACDKARELLQRIDSYPILDEFDYSERQTEAVQEWWRTESLRYRVQMCAENGDSIFAARHDYPPEHVEQCLMEESFA